MDALILSCATGGGHNSAGKAILEALETRGHRAEMLNPYTLRSNRLAGQIDRAYVSTAQRAPRAFGAVYGAGQLYRRLPFRSPVYFANKAMTNAVQNYLEQHHYDIIFMPHLFPAEIVTNMKFRGIKLPKTMFVATDYCCTPFTEETECDAYIAPTAELVSDFFKRGIPAQKLYPCGIPTLSGFSETEPREAAMERVGLNPKHKYILISGGSFGAGSIGRVLEVLLQNFHESREVRFMVICGSNRQLREQLSARFGNQNNQLTVLGHTNHMADYLKSSHLYITKPGGLSSTEAAVCGVPILHMFPIPGCETFNARYFESHGMSLYCEKPENCVSAVVQLLYDEKARAKMVACQRENLPQNAAGQICRLAEKMVAQETFVN